MMAHGNEAAMTDVGIIGLGKMGMPIARNLMAKGFGVVGFRRTPGDGLAEAGGVRVSSPAEVAERADVLLSILPDAAAVEEVVCGPQGTLQALRKGTVHIEMSTVEVDRKAAVRAAVRAAGGELLDAPISGSPPMVEPRMATTFVSGDEHAIESVKPVLDAISGPWVHAGAFGNGAGLKYVSAMLMAAHTVAAAEALAFARRQGLDLELVQRTLDGSIAASALLKQRGPWMREGRYEPAPGPIETLEQILHQVADIVPPDAAPVFTAAKQVFDQAMRDGNGHKDIAFVHAQLQEGRTV
ncbi:NAD(P)-dependent oxidoreductase [Actinoplanes sp. NPDC051633]|uniref:NAD(P)-dependent oxidoreductase n=1 Tax=Actinoplanes sp. NPDC051633 TaxID=3155670 RepID=UPI003412AFC7